jgi:hypothetical protein
MARSNLDPGLKYFTGGLGDTFMRCVGKGENAAARVSLTASVIHGEALASPDKVSNAVFRERSPEEIKEPIKFRIKAARFT